MGINQLQAQFATNVSKLILFANDSDYYITLGEGYDDDNEGHTTNSLHYQRLAIDLCLFDCDWNYLQENDDYELLGLYWESLGDNCYWGGRFSDGNHFSMSPDNRR